MKQISAAVALLCVGGLSLTGCERPQEKPLSAEAEACRAQIAAFRSNVGLDDVKLRRMRNEVVEQTLSLTNSEERIVLFREFVKEFYKIDIGKCTVEEAIDMVYEYYSDSEYLAYGLLRAGGSTDEAWQSLVTGLEKYRQLCFSFGDENGMSDGRGDEAGIRRHAAQWGPKVWKNTLRFCRDTTIRTVFGPDKETIERLQARLVKRFGKIEERRSR